MKDFILISCIILVTIPACKKKNLTGEKKPSRDFLAAEYYNYYDLKDSAFYYYNRVVNNSSDSLEKGAAYFQMGFRLLEAGDYYSAQENLLLSIKVLDQSDSSHFSNLSSDYNTLANATLNLKDYESAIKYYYLASKFAQNSNSKLNDLNNLGVAFQKKGDLGRAIAIFDSAMAQTIPDTLLRAQIISNFARTKWLDQSNYDALPEFMTALNLRIGINDSLGINASFAHLSDYYTNSNHDSAYYYALKRFEIAKTLQDPGDRLEALNQLIKVGPVNETKQYIAQYINLADSLAIVHSRDRNQYVLIKFDAEKSKADNLLLQRHLGIQRVIIWGTAALAIILIVFLIARSRAKSMRLKLQSENELRQSKLKTSQKVHDVVANGLYRIMNELEHKENFDREPLLNRIELLYEKSRDISYEDLDDTSYKFSLQMHQLLTSFANNSTKVIIVGNDETFWEEIAASQKQQLQLVISELLINMQRHSHSKNVLIQFKKDKNFHNINYKDDGVGFPKDVKFGNGLNNTVNRIKSIGGEVNFETSGENGLTISISFPPQLL